MRRSGSDEDARAKTIQASEDASLDETLPSDTFERISSNKLDMTKETIAPASSAEPAIERGMMIGRYAVMDRLGSGTMGIVVSAIDPTLDRKIAIKLVRADSSGSTVGRQRLLREAQAMARLSHPNVVTVFEVGTFGDRVFLAMEFIAGATLGEYLEQPGRTQREILAAFLAAGSGLAAAHRAGIVHRDFKPANVLVSKDGRVRVADFGLATAPEARASTPPPIEVESPNELAMTQTGAILGTPAYMAPEQHRGQGAEASADQFAFCVALYEAVYGELPFEGNDYLVYAENVLAGRVREAPKGTAVPAWLRKVLVRGLALDAAHRYPSMDALLADLANDPAVRRRRIAIIAGLAGSGVLATGAVAFALSRDGGAAGDPCATAGQPVAALWNADLRDKLHKAFATSGARNVESVFEHTAKAFDRRAQELAAARRDACLATAVRHEQSAALLDRRMHCIDLQGAQMQALLGVLSDAPNELTVRKSVAAVAMLPPVSQCADRNLLLTDVPAPHPAALAQAEALRRDLDRAQALEDTGRFKVALEVTNRAVATADNLGYAPLQARAYMLSAKVKTDLGQYEEAASELRKVGELAAAAHDDHLIARAWILLYGTLGYRLARTAEAKSFEPSVVAAIVRAGNTTEQRGYLENARGAILLAAGEYAQAAEKFELAAKLTADALGQNHPKVAASLGNAATALENSGKYAEARKALDRALAINIELQGSEHPDVAVNRYQLGSLLDTTGKHEESLAEFKKALAINEKNFPPDHPELAKEYVSIGVVLVNLDRAKEALDYHLKAIEIFRAHAKDNQPRLIIALMDLANTYRALERNADAIKTYEEALEIAKKTLGPDHVEIADILNNMALAVYLGGDKKRGVAMWKQVLSIRETKLGKDHPEVAKALGPLADDAYRRSDYKQAIAYLDRAIAILEKLSGPKLPLTFMMVDLRAQAKVELRRHADAAADFTKSRDGYLALGLVAEAAAARLNLADALWAQSKRADAAAEARTAVQELEAVKPKPDPDAVAKAKAWLTKHRVK